MGEDDLEIAWNVPGRTDDVTSSNSNTNGRSKRAMRCLELAATCARDFDKSFDMHDAERECSLPQFHSSELILSEQPDRIAGYFTEYRLQQVTLLSEEESDNEDDEDDVVAAKRRFAARSDDGFYSVKYLQEGIIEQDHAPNAATELILEVKILMSLAQHPHIGKLYGVTSSGLKALTRSGPTGYFFITDRITETLVQRMETWRNGLAYASSSSSSSFDTTTTTTHAAPPCDITQRLEVALDIASALVFLHDRKLVFYMRPDKVGFDARHGSVKLFNFGQARQHGMESHPRSVTQSDNMQTLAYTAPEVFCMSASHPGTDVYGFGVMLWEMISLKRPFVEYDRATHFEHVVRRNQRPLPVDDHWDAGMATMVQSCWHPNKRPTMKNVHAQLETRLLYQETSNQICDTARILQRQRSEEVVHRLMDEIGSPRHLSSSSLHASSSEKVLALFSTSTGLEVAEVESGMLHSQGSFHLDDLHNEIEKEVKARKANASNSSESLRASTASLSASESSLQSMDLEQIIQDVSSSFASSTDDSNARSSDRSSRASDSKYLRSSKTKSGKRRSRRLPSGPKKATGIEPTDYDPQTSKIASMEVSASFSMNGSEKLDVMEHDECADDLIASLIEQSNGRGEIGSPSSMVATYDPSPNPEKVSPLERGRSFDSPQKQRRTLLRVRKTIVAITASPKQSVSNSIQRLRTRSKSSGRSEKRTLSTGDLSEFLSGVNAPTETRPTSKDDNRMNPQTVVSQILARVPKAAPIPKIRIKEVPQVPELLDSHVTLPFNESDDAFEKKRYRRASIAEVKGSFDFYPDPVKRTASTDVIKQLQDVIEKATTATNTPEYPSSPTKMTMMGKRMLGNIRRLGASNGRQSLAWPPESPGPTLKPSMRRSSLVHEIVSQNKSCRDFDGNNSGGLVSVDGEILDR